MGDESRKLKIVLMYDLFMSVTGSITEVGLLCMRLADA